MDLFNFIKTNIDIVSVIGEYTNLKKAGSLYWKGRCPFHHEQTPSFTVSPHKNIFYCFGCHVTGDVISFIEKIEHLSPYDAIQHLAQRHNLQIPKEIQQQSVGNSQANKNYYQLCYSFASWCHQMLSKNSAALEYVHKRNLHNATITHFTIGVFPSGSRNMQSLISHISNDGFTSQDLINAHILQQGKQGLYSPFENRIMFPIKDHIGNVCGFGGRIFLPDDTRPKYYNSMDSVHFKKGKILYALDSAKHDIQKQHAAFIVEGYMDTVALWQLGFKNAVATLGTACSVDHLQQLTRHAQTIYLLYDADSAGQQAIMRLASSCWQLNLDLKVVCLPSSQDPASMLEQNNDIAPYIQKADTIFNFFISTKTKTFAQDSMKQKMDVLHELFEIIKQVDDVLKQNILLMKASESLQIPLEILKNEYTKKYAPVRNVPLNNVSLPTQGVRQEEQQGPSKLENQIIAALAHKPNMLTDQDEVLLTACLSQQPKSIIEKIIDHRQTHKTSCTHQIEEMIDQPHVEYVRNCMFSFQDGNIEETFRMLMEQFQKKYWKSVTGIIKMKIIQAKNDHNLQEVQRLLKVFEQLKLDVCKNSGRL